MFVRFVCPLLRAAAVELMQSNIERSSVYTIDQMCSYFSWGITRIVRPLAKKIGCFKKKKLNIEGEGGLCECL